MHTQFNFAWILNLLRNEGVGALVFHVGIFLVVVFPVILVIFWGSISIVIPIAIALAVVIALLLSSLVVAMNVYRQKEEIFLANAGDALVVIDRSWKIELWNKTAEILTGWSANDVIGKPFRDVVKFIRERDQTEDIEFIEEAMIYGRVGNLEDHTVLIRKDGLQIPIGDSAAPLFDPQGTVIGAIIVFRDKSREHDLEDARQEFMSLVTRELHAPLGTMKENLNLMLGALTLTPGDVKAREYSEILQSANDRIYSLVNTMLNVLSVEQGKLTISPEPGHLPELADTALADFSTKIMTKKISVERIYEENIPSLNLDLQLMRTILLSLLSNAVSYTPEGGTISIQIKKDNGGVVLSISDTGYGIPKHQQAKVFSKLFRADNVRSRNLEGVGLGLYMAKNIVEQTGGKIWFESEENTRTTFYLFIPSTGMKKREGTTGIY